MDNFNLSSDNFFWTYNTFAFAAGAVRAIQIRKLPREEHSNAVYGGVGEPTLVDPLPSQLSQQKKFLKKYSRLG